MKIVIAFMIFFCLPHVALGVEENIPKYLYKILSESDWKESQHKGVVIKSKEDIDFIHLSTHEQLNRIIEKFWSQAPIYIVLKIQTEHLPGRLVYESNPGGTSKYYHLYDALIPLNSIVAQEIVDQKNIK